ncbi:MAG: DUF1573 domain-containing protein [bacterium]
MAKLFVILAVICCFQISNLLSQDSSLSVKRDLINTPIIDIVPSVLEIENDTSKFVVENVTVLNRGIGVLHITSITGSCYCSNGVIEKNDVQFLDTGKLRLEINKKGLKNEENMVIYTVTSNAKNSPFYIKVKFVEKK